MKKRFIFIVLLMFSTNLFAEDICDKRISEAEAKKIAIEFLELQEWSKEYIKEPEYVAENRCEWIVSFKSKKDEKPGEGWVSVNQISGHAKWVPLR